MKKIVEYLIVTGSSPNEIERQVEIKIGMGYQPFGSLCAIAAGGNSGNLYAQPMIKYEGTDDELRGEIEKALSEFQRPMLITQVSNLTTG